MTIYNVHIYREMRLVFGGIKADSPEAAAAIARDKLTSDADSIDDCDGETFAALVDVAGDEQYEQSVTIDFEPERQRKAAPKLLMAVRMAENYLADDLDEDDETEMRIFNAICDARAEANAVGIRAEPPAPALLASLRAILPYAENEAYALDKHKDSPEAEAEAKRAWKAIESAHAAIAGADAAPPRLRQALEDVAEWLETGMIDGVHFDEASILATIREALAPGHKASGDGRE